jgi:two-component system heavy metal sensor histidine kinase CusS
VRLRARLVLAMTAVTLLTLGLSFWAVAFAFNRGQERQLDEALLVEAGAVAAKAVTGSGAFAIADGPGPEVNDSEPLPLFGVIYDAEGTARAMTSTFGDAAPALDALRHPARKPFDFRRQAMHLRGVMVPVPDRPGALLMLAVPRTDLDGDAAFLARAMRGVFAVAVAWSLLVPAWLIRRLTRDQQAIADVVLRVADGDLKARVRSRSTDPELNELAGRIDTMIERLALLLESQQRFVAHAAHELRSPLTVVHGQLALALRRPRTEPEYRGAIEEALGATTHLRALTEELLDFARAGAASAGPFEPTCVARAARSAVRYVHGDAEQASVAIDLRVGEALVPGRATDLERLLRNLVENAVRHSPAGGRVLVEAAARGAVVEITVADEGNGVPEPERPKLFEPFFRGAEAQRSSGAGLGLAIAREIARAHGGDVDLDTTAPRGARFVVRLPLWQRPAAETAQSSSVTAALHSS